MHAFNNTLLSKMGFMDKDKRLPSHDDACISIVENPLAILSLLTTIDKDDISVELEKPLTKGSGQYMSTVGFTDAIIRWDEKASYMDSALVEVKTHIESIGELLRQMNLYRQHAAVSYYVVWSLDPADARHAKVLKSQGYILLIGPIGAVVLATVSDPPATNLAS